MRAMIMKEFRELRRDRRTLAMLVALPIVLLVIFGYAANFTITSIPTAVVGPASQQLADQLPDLFDIVDVSPDSSTADAQDLVQDNTADVVIDTGTTPPVAYIDGSALFVAQTAKAALSQAGGQVTIDILYNPDLLTSWVMVPALIGLILAFIGTIITSIGMVRERQTGTLEQLAVMPLRPSDVIIGKIAPYFILAAIDFVVVTILGVWIFGVPFNGSPLLLALGGAIFLFAVLGIGVLISTTSQTQGQAIQVAILVLLPQILLSGFIFPLQAMGPAVRWIGYLLPLTYFVEISQGIMLRGAPAASLWVPFAVLTAMAVIVFTAAVLRFRRDLAPRIPELPQSKATSTDTAAPA
jgi:ABC transporter DrrB family efflux protein